MVVARAMWLRALPCWIKSEKSRSFERYLQVEMVFEKIMHYVLTLYWLTNFHMLHTFTSQQIAVPFRACL